MANVWLIGLNGDSVWSDGPIPNGIAIDWDDHCGHEGYNSLKMVKKYHDDDFANAIWYFYKRMNIDDIVVAIKDNNVSGIGMIKSECYGRYNYDDDYNINPLDWHFRYVKWSINPNDDISAEDYYVNMINDVRKWNKNVEKSIDMHPKFKEAFDALQLASDTSFNSAQDSYLSNDSILSNAFVHTKNVILYGPPGTGKTYTIQQFIKSFLADQLSIQKTDYEVKVELLRDLNWYQVTALAMYMKRKEEKKDEYDLLSGDLIKWKEEMDIYDILSKDIIKCYSEIFDEQENIILKMWTLLHAHSNPENKNINYEKRRNPILFDKTEHNEWYLVPDGIDYVETNLTSLIGFFEEITSFDKEKYIEEFCTFITFHQSYGYEDFIEGLKPIINNAGDVSYRIENGVFKEICEKAKFDPENKYILVIDEINRGNIAKIFGELITLIEDDKRSGNANQMCTKLPYSKTEFAVPSNLYILGTMNTADRSIALLDIALRRRFTFLEIMPDYSIIKFDVDGVNIASLLKGLNIMVSALIDRDHQIGHSYFCDLADLKENQAKEKLYFIWYKKIIPLLQEYFYNDWEQLKLILGDFVVENGTSRVPALKDKIVNKSYEIRDFEGDWDTFSRALKHIYGANQENVLAQESVESAVVADYIEE